VLKRTFGPKREEVAEGCRKLHKKELHNLHASQNIIRIMRWTLHVAWMREIRNAYKLFIGKPDGKRSCGRLRRRWKKIL
jgi:hypothetical protein